MVKVTVDVTGYFYSAKVDVPKEATVQEVMAAAVAADAGAPATKARMIFAPDPNDEFISEIIVLHRNGSAKSRQVDPKDPPRQYDDGFYSFNDFNNLSTEMGPNGVPRFAPREAGDSRALAWQFYVYKKTDMGLVDLSRSQRGGLLRVVEPFSRATPFAAGKDDDEYELVWRLVALALRADRLEPTRLATLAARFA